MTLDSGEWIMRKQDARRAEAMAILEAQVIDVEVGLTKEEANDLGRMLRNLGARPSMTGSTLSSILFKIGR